MMIVLYTMYPVLAINPRVNSKKHVLSRKELMVSKMVVLRDVVYREEEKERERGKCQGYLAINFQGITW